MNSIRQQHEEGLAALQRLRSQASASSAASSRAAHCARARARALEFDWGAVSRQFLSHLAPIRRWKPDAGYPAIAQLA